MTTRSDVIVEFESDPRIAEVEAPSVEFTMQDIVDTLRKQEDGFSTGLAHVKLLDASGKEDLGGGVKVGITVALQNTQIAFEARRTPAESGTVTTGSSAPINIQIGQIIDFEDATADFISANIQPGSMVINFTDRSIADVYRVENSTKLTTKLLVNGTTNTFQVGDVYQVFNIVQCELSGGNIVAVDETDSAISPVLPTAFTQVIRSASSSATLISGGLPAQQEIRDAMQLTPTGVTQPDSIDEKLDDIPADVVAAINASLHDGRTFTDILQDLLAMASGRIEESPSGTFTFYERDNTTPRFVLTKTATERNRT